MQRQVAERREGYGVGMCVKRCLGTKGDAAGAVGEGWGGRGGARDEIFEFDEIEEPNGLTTLTHR